MRPPICEVCEKGMRENEDCKLIYFKKSEKDLKWDEKASQPGYVGHPPYAGWFCSEHLERAEELAHLTLPEAMKILNKEF